MIHKIQKAEPRSQEHCRIIVQNDVLGSRAERITPQSADEAEENLGTVVHALDWAREHSELNAELVEDPTLLDTPIDVAIHKLADRIVIHWYPTGDDIDAARAAMQEILAERGAGR